MKHSINSHHLKKIILVCLALLIFIFPVNAVDFLNFGFEYGVLNQLPTNWENAGDSDCLKVNSSLVGPYSGDFSCRYSGDYQSIIRQPVNLTGVNNISLWYTCGSSKWHSIYIEIYTYPGNVFVSGVQTGSVIDKPWTKFTYSGLSLVGDHYVRLRQWHSGSDWSSIDHVLLNNDIPVISSSINWYPDADSTNSTIFRAVEFDLSGEEHSWYQIAYYKSIYINESWTDYALQRFNFVGSYEICGGPSRCTIIYFQVAPPTDYLIPVAAYWTSDSMSTVKWKVVLINPLTDVVIDYDEILYSPDYTWDDFYNDTPVPVVTPTPVPTPVYTPVPTPTPYDGPDEVNNSINTSWSSDYYDYIDGAMGGFEGDLENISDFTSKPIDDFTTGIGNVTDLFNENSNYSNHKWILLEILPAVFGSMPASIQKLITLGFVFMVVLIVFGRDK